LTLLGNTKSISFPATVSTDGGLTLTAKFELDRTKFGMNYGVGKVEKTVTMTIAIGKSESN
jgi:polyisoprenoid-binding protein YceI